MITPWVAEQHLSLLGSWLRGRGQADGAGPASLYPAVGFVVDGIAIGFLYQTDAPGVAWVDGFVTHPESKPEERAKALRELVEALYAKADALGITVVWSSTAIPSLVELGQACGAQIYQRKHVCLVRTLR